MRISLSKQRRCCRKIKAIWIYSIKIKVCIYQKFYHFNLLGLGISSPVKISRTATDNNKGHKKSKIEREEVNKKMSNFYYK